MRNLTLSHTLPIILALLAGLSLWLPLPFAVQFGATVLLTLLLPGWTMLQATRLPGIDRLEQLTLAIGLSYGVTTLATLALVYTLGGLSVATLTGVLVGFVLLAAAFDRLRSGITHDVESVSGQTLLFFLLPVAVAAFLSFTHLAFADYWGDEMNGLLRAVSIDFYHGEAIFEHTKGPVEVLLPAAFGLLTDHFEPFTLRFPFALAFVAGIGGFFLLVRRLFDETVALAAALLLAINGLHLAFGRMVQYQSIVLLTSNLALLLTYHYIRHERRRALALAILLVALGLLAHYDTLLTLPPMAFLVWLRLRWNPAAWRQAAPELLGAGALLLVTTLAFYLPYILTPQADETSSYLARRIAEGGLINNNFDDLYLFSVMYNSRYYMLLVAGLGLTTLIYDLRFWLYDWRNRWFWTALAVTGVLCGLAALAEQTTLIAPLLTLLVLGLLITGDGISAERKLIYVWAGAAFVGYVYLVDDPRTHLRMIYPGWSVLAALALVGAGRIIGRWLPSTTVRRVAGAVAAVLLAGLFGVLAYYPYLLFVDTAREYIFTYPTYKNEFYWEDPAFPFSSRRLYGAPHRLGWQMINQLFVEGQLAGDWDSNDDGSNLFWYTLGSPRNPCYPRYFFLTQFEQRESDAPPPDFDRLGYQKIGEVWQGDRLQIEVFEFAPLGPKAEPTIWREPASYNSFVRLSSFESQPYQETPPVIEQPLPDPKPVFRPSREGLQQIADQFNDPRITQVRDQAELLGYDIDPTWAQPGGVLPVTLFWQAPKVINLPYKVFVHLVDDQGRVVAQSDDIPNCGTRPTHQWPLFKPVMDRHLLRLPNELPSGSYTLTMGLYEPQTGVRMDLLDQLGNPQGISLALPPMALPQ